MHKVSIQPQWTIRHGDATALSSKLLSLLVQVHESGSLSAACRLHGASYRHAWELVRAGEAMFGAPLLRMERGKGSTLTPLGETLVWADRRIAARLNPVLASLSSELEVEIARVISANPPPLRVHASHGFAVETMFEAMARRQVAVERKYVPSVDALASLHEGGCDLAGFHVPLGSFEGRILAEYARWLDAASCRVICTVKRRQGLMVAAGNPRKIYDVADLTRADVRFINRQRGSGTRLLLECLLDQAGIASDEINGFEHGEYTHAAIAAYVASGMADVGIGIETPARQFKLDFIPIASERYFLVCHEDALRKPQFEDVLDILGSAEFHDAINRLPGYSLEKSGAIQTLPQVFPGRDFPSAPKRRPGAHSS